jgi:hypothetical protein
MPEVGRMWNPKMLRTIQIGSGVSVQGILIKALENGKLLIRVGDKTFEGFRSNQYVLTPTNR